MPLFRRFNLTFQDESISQGAAATINVVGSAAAVTVDSSVATLTISAGSSSGSPAGNTSSLQYNNSGSFNGMSLVKTDGNYIIIASSSFEDVPSKPDAGSVKIFNHDIAGRMMLSMRGPSGIHTALQPVLSRNNIGIWDHPGNSTAAMTTWGLTAPTTSGTLTARTVAVTNVATMARRIGLVSAATAGSMCGARSAVGQFTMASGFMVVFRFFNSDAAAVANAKLWVGMTSVTTAFTGSGADPSSFNNAWGVGADGGQTNLAVMARGATTATTASLGSNFPANTLNKDFYEVALFCPPSGTTIGYRVENISTGNIIAGTMTTNLPSSTTLLMPQLWRGNGTTALAVGLDIVSVYMETDN